MTGSCWLLLWRNFWIDPAQCPALQHQQHTWRRTGHSLVTTGPPLACWSLEPHCRPAAAAEPLPPSSCSEGQPRTDWHQPPRSHQPPPAQPLVMQPSHTPPPLRVTSLGCNLLGIMFIFPISMGIMLVTQWAGAGAASHYQLSALLMKPDRHYFLLTLMHWQHNE